MSKKILVLTGSARKNGNSERMAEVFVAEARTAGHSVTCFDTANKHILPCRACDSCFSADGACVFNDDFNALAPLLAGADVIVLATPLYWYSFPASIKAALDKMYAFIIGGKELHIKESVLLVCGEIAEERVFDGIRKSYELIAEDRGWTDRGQIIAPGVNFKGDIEKTNALDKIRKLAHSL